ncbi:MAG: thiamine phosphate synthase [Oligoflexus sp.]
MSKTSNKVWLIGGLDPSGGAGLMLDHRVVHSYEVLAPCVVSCMTAQSHKRCIDIRPLTCEEIIQQFEMLVAGGAPAAIKIGMIAGHDALQTIAELISHVPVAKIIDPILATSSGYQIADQEWLTLFRELLLPQASLMTPNLPEAEAISGIKITDEESLQRTGHWFLEHGCKTVLIKGGHRFSPNDAEVRDLLFDENGRMHLIAPHHDYAIRGTGCFLASAVAAGLAKQQSLRDAIVYARAKLMQAMQTALGDAQHMVLNANTPALQLPGLTDAVVQPRAESFAPVEADELRLYPIVDRCEWLERLLPLGVKTVQIRIKDLLGDELEGEIKRACEIAARFSCRLYINDYWQLAIKHGAYGVHLGQEDLAHADLDAIQKSGLRLGISTHSYEELARALSIRPSYVALGPIFATTCKSMQFGPQGIAKISEWVQFADCPVVAIGGLKPEHASAVLQQGAAGLALISDITGAADPEGRTRVWLKSISS